MTTSAAYSMVGHPPIDEHVPEYRHIRLHNARLTRERVEITRPGGPLTLRVALRVGDECHDR